jgi:hypothetical protein
MAIKGQVKLIKDPDRGWVMILLDQNNIKAQAVDKFIKHDTTVSVILNMELKRPHVEKTLSQLGYLHAAVWPCFYRYYEDQGIPVVTPEQKRKVRDDVKKVIGFVSVDRAPLNPDHASDFNDHVKSFADASKEEASEAIDAIIRLGADFGIIIEEPGAYLEQHGVKDFE